MKKFLTFFIGAYRFDENTCTAFFTYRFDENTSFTETVTFPRKGIRNFIDENVLDSLLFHLSVSLGVSYYKLYPTKNIVVEHGKLDEKQQKFRKDFYVQGLGEFFYTNNLDPKGLANFINISDKNIGKQDFGLSNKYLVPIGGGKDSIVSIELLKSQGVDMTLFSHGRDYSIHQATEKNAGYERIITQRKIDPLLIELSKKEFYFNGHVPITGMISFLSVVVSYLYDFKYIVFSNEKSANFGNTERKGLSINHQRSKSLLFENAFREYIYEYIHEEIEYFSLLRPWYEVHIAEQFSKYKQYFSSFTSCNRNFHLDGARTSQWCLHCPKCFFVYIILRGFLSDEEAKNIWGQELYKKSELLANFQEIRGEKGIKAFECVGTYEEAQYATWLYIQSLKKVSEKLPDILSWFDNYISQRKTLIEWQNLGKSFLSPIKDNNVLGNIPIIFHDIFLEK